MMPTLNIADLSLAIIWLFFAVRGYMRGLVKEAGSLAAIITAFYLAGTYHKVLAPNLSEYISGNYAGTAAYLLIFTVALMGVWFVALAISGIVKVTMTQWADRFFGGGFGLVKGVILTAVLLFLLRLAMPDPDFLKGSMLVPVLDKVSGKLVNYIPPDINEKLRRFGKKELPDPIKAALEKKAAAAAAATAAAVLDKKPADPDKKPEAPKAEDKHPAAEPGKPADKKPAEPAKEPDKKPAAKPEAKAAEPAKKPEAKPAEAKAAEHPAKKAAEPAKPAGPDAKAAPEKKAEPAKSEAPKAAPEPKAPADKHPTAPAAKPARPADTDKPS